MTVGDVLRRATEELEQAGIERARVDSEHLVGHALGLTRTRLYAEPHRRLAEAELDAVRALVERRARREPLAYVLGEWGFRRLTLKVDARALVPRPETEALVERCLELIGDLRAPEVLDVGTGSGAIALALADEHPGARVTGFDTSADALALARENAAALGLAQRVDLREHDLYDGFGEELYDLVVSNPPYVGADELPSLEAEVRDWEPRVALVAAGQTEAVARAAAVALRPGAPLALEVADGQAHDVAATLGRLGFVEIRITRDLAGRERVVDGRRVHDE